MTALDATARDADDEQAEQPDEPIELVALEPRHHGAVGSAIPDLPVIPMQNETTAIAQLAVTLAAASAVPSAMRGKPNDVFLVLLTARDLGVSLTTAMREFHVIEGRVSLSPKVKLAMVRQTGVGSIWPDAENDAESATWYARRHDLPEHQIASTFTWADAQLAHLVDSRCTAHEHWRASGSGRNSAECLCKTNWKTYPARMLSWRAVGYLLDDVFPEIGTGLYSPDELGAVTDAEGEPIEVRAVEGLPGMRGGARTAAPVELAPDDVRAAIAERVERAKAHDDAHADLRAWWVDQQLPKPAELTAGQARKVEARLTHTEQRYELDVEPSDDESSDSDEQTSATTDDAQSDEPIETTQVPPDPAGDAEGAQESAIPSDLTASTDAARDLSELGPGDDGDLAGWLIERASSMTRVELVAAYDEGDQTPPRGNVALLRRSWAIWQFERIARAVTQLLSLWTIPLDGIPTFAELDA